MSDPTPQRWVSWDAWTPTEEATLLFVLPGNGQVLLIHKKRGLGSGLINAPGGRIEPGEDPRDAAVRETFEEVGLRVRNPANAGLLRFHALDGYNVLVHVFTCRAYEGIPTETDEATPEWFPTHSLPLDRMWADDQHWLPPVLDGRSVKGWFVFDGHSLLWHDVRITDLP